MLIDVDDVALGHESRLRWNDRNAWVWSSDVVHEPLIGVDDFRRAQDMFAGGGRAKSRTREPDPAAVRPSGSRALRVCERRMQGQWDHNRPYCRCRYPREYALANTVEHPGNVYVASDDRATVYRRLGLRLTYAPDLRTVRAAIEISAHTWGCGLCPRTELNHNPTVVHRADLQLRNVDMA